jgi:hypothetical protein
VSSYADGRKSGDDECGVRDGVGGDDGDDGDDDSWWC